MVEKFQDLPPEKYPRSYTQSYAYRIRNVKRKQPGGKRVPLQEGEAELAGFKGVGKTRKGKY